MAERVEFTSLAPGDRAGMATLLGGVSLVVLMSEYETHPLVGLEAAAARRRLLVADDHAGLRELSEDGLARLIPLGVIAARRGRSGARGTHAPGADRRPQAGDLG